MNRLRSILRSEKGITLFEVVAAVLIITLITSSTYAVIVQSAKVTRTSTNITSANYTAQVVIEDIFQHARAHTLPDINTLEVTGLAQPLDKYVPQVNTVPNEYQLLWKGEFDVRITFSYKGSVGDVNENLTSLVVQVITKNTDKVKAQKETIIEWRK